MRRRPKVLLSCARRTPERGVRVAARGGHVGRRSGFARILLGGLLCVLVCGGCGRPATKEDCELIIDRNVELQMKQMQITEPSAVEKRKTEIRSTMNDELKGCIGKRVTDGMMSCVRKAQTADEIDQCLR
jgi:hypothetical protein